MNEIEEDYENWYTLQVRNQRELTTIDTIALKKNNEGMTSIVRTYVPTEEIMSISPKGKKTLLIKPIYPGYVFIKMDYAALDVVEILDLPFSQKFIGTKTDPIRMSKAEAKKILNHENKEKKTKYRISFEKGDMVRVKEGAFADYKGEVGEINHEQNEVNVIVRILGRETSLRVPLHDLERIED